MVEVKVVLPDNIFAVKLKPDLDILDLFLDFKREFKLEGEPSDYLFFLNRAFPIERGTNIATVTRGRAHSILTLIKKEDYAKCEKHGPFLQAIQKAALTLTEEQRNLMCSIHHTRSFILHYFDEKYDCLGKMLETIPIDRLQSDDPEENLKIITKWFKEEFFTFIRQPPCHVCGGPTNGIGSSRPTKYESEGFARNVEVFRCNKCGACTRFPRYDMPERLIETRRGRCSEFANVFTAMLISFGFDARVVLDLTDHVWTEVWLDSKQRYVHVDPCENIIDAPYTYEKGWGKKLTWIMAFGPHEIYDVTPRYTQNMDAVIQRRSLQVSEEWYHKIIEFRNAQYQKDLSDEEKEEIRKKNELDQKSMEIIREEIKSEEERPRISGNE